MIKFLFFSEKFFKFKSLQLRYNSKSMMHSKVKIGVIGLGYVGLPLAVEFSKKFNVIGYDISQNRIR
jgi:hypothetical protein